MLERLNATGKSALVAPSEYLEVAIVNGCGAETRDERVSALFVPARRRNKRNNTGPSMKSTCCTRALASQLNSPFASVAAFMPSQPSAPTNCGRRFWVLAALSLGPAVATSFARFAYALILPAMRAELDLSYSQAGSLNTANALGYLVGALLCKRFVPRLGNRRLFSFGLVVTVLASSAQASLKALANRSPCARSQA